MNKMSAISKSIVCTILFASCSVVDTGIAKRVDNANGKLMSNDSRRLQDTPAHWAEFQRMMDMHIDREKSGQPPYYGYKTTWDEFWGSVIDVLTPERQEDHQKYVTYVVESRRRAGLPELHQKL